MFPTHWPRKSGHCTGTGSSVFRICTPLVSWGIISLFKSHTFFGQMPGKLIYLHYYNMHKERSSSPVPNDRVVRVGGHKCLQQKKQHTENQTSTLGHSLANSRRWFVCVCFFLWRNKYLVACKMSF